MFQEGNFFLALIPGSEGISFSIQPNQVYEIIAEDEHRIVTSLFLYDHDLFLFIYKELFEDSLIPYMSRKELSKVISQIDDHGLSEILDYPSRKKRLYSGLVSKNRMAYLKKLNRDKIRKIDPSPIWSRVKNAYRQEKQRLISLPTKEHGICKIIKETKSFNFKKEFHLRKKLFQNRVRSLIWISKEIKYIF